MGLIDDIREKVAAGSFEFSRHALDQTLRRNISLTEVREAIASGEMIEDYPKDKYGPTCLILGWTSTRRPLHIQCSYPSRPIIKVITLYEPDEDLWKNFRERKQ